MRNAALDAAKSERRRARREAKASRPEAWFAEASIDGLDVADAVDALRAMPLDPATGQAFDYSVKDGVATLSGGVIGPQPQRVYEVRLRK